MKQPFNQTYVPFLLIACFAVLGVIYLIKSHAITPVLSMEPESGSVAASSQIVADATASNGKAVQFIPASAGSWPAWPTASSTVTVTTTQSITGSKDYNMTRFVAGGAMGDGGQSESQQPIFNLADGSTLSNVIIGAPAADGIHCLGSCTLNNVWWEDVGEDAATFKAPASKPNAVMTVNGGGAKLASDKVFQHNGPGTFVIENFQVDDFGKLYRSCGNCSTQYSRHVIIDSVLATYPGKDIVGINSNYGDTASIKDLTIAGDTTKKLVVCAKYMGNNSGAEPPQIGSGPDSSNCLYTSADVTYK